MEVWQMTATEKLTRDQLIERLVSIYRYETVFEDFDHYESEVRAINALLTGGS